MPKVKRPPQKTPGRAYSYAENDDFTLPLNLYRDAIMLLEVARDARKNSRWLEDEGRYLRASLYCAFAFFEATLNAAAFAHADTHRDVLEQIERDVLEEKETVMDDTGHIVRRIKFYPLEARFQFIVMFLSGKPFDKSSPLWNELLAAKALRDTWVHPKPPFDTWSLTAEKVERAVRTVREVLAELSRMMGLPEPSHLPPYDDAVASHREQGEKFYLAQP